MKETVQKILEMTPDDDWKALDLLDERQAKMLLRMQIVNLRIMHDTVAGKDMLSPKTFTIEGHAKCTGLAMGSLISWENFYKMIKDAPQAESDKP